MATGRVPEPPPAYDPETDPDYIGWVLVVLPPLLALPCFYFPVAVWPAHALLWVVFVLVMFLDAPRWDLPPTFWAFALTCLWPLALPAYFKSRSDSGGPDRFYFSVVGTMSATLLFYVLPVVIGSI